jgi:hypothetical protein
MLIWKHWWYVQVASGGGQTGSTAISVQYDNLYYLFGLPNINHVIKFVTS